MGGDMQSALENSTIFRGIIVAMFSIILAMTGYIVSTFSQNFDSINGQLDMMNARQTRANERIDDLRERMAVTENDVKRLFMPR